MCLVSGYHCRTTSVTRSDDGRVLLTIRQVCPRRVKTRIPWLVRWVTLGRTDPSSTAPVVSRGDLSTLHLSLLLVTHPSTVRWRDTVFVCPMRGSSGRDGRQGQCEAVPSELPRGGPCQRRKRRPVPHLRLTHTECVECDPGLARPSRRRDGAVEKCFRGWCRRATGPLFLYGTLPVSGGPEVVVRWLTVRKVFGGFPVSLYKPRLSG